MTLSVPNYYTDIDPGLPFDAFLLGRTLVNQADLPYQVIVGTTKTYIEIGALSGNGELFLPDANDPKLFDGLQYTIARYGADEFSLNVGLLFTTNIMQPLWSRETLVVQWDAPANRWVPILKGYLNDASVKEAVERYLFAPLITGTLALDFDQNQEIDLEAVIRNYVALPTWTAPRTITLVGVPHPQLTFWLSNLSGQVLNLAGAITLGSSPYPLASGTAILLTEFSGGLMGKFIETGVIGSVADNSITFAKMQDLTVSKLLGRGSTGAGDPEEIQLGSNLSMSGNTLNAAGGGAGSADWGGIGGSLPDQLDLQAELDGKASIGHTQAITSITGGTQNDLMGFGVDGIGEPKDPAVYANPPQVTGPEKTLGSGTAVRLMSVVDVKDISVLHGGGGSGAVGGLVPEDYALSTLLINETHYGKLYDLVSGSPISITLDPNAINPGAGSKIVGLRKAGGGVPTVTPGGLASYFVAGDNFATTPDTDPYDITGYSWVEIRSNAAGNNSIFVIGGDTSHPKTVYGPVTFIDPPIVPDASFAIAKIAGLQAVLDAIKVDSFTGHIREPENGTNVLDHSAAYAYTIDSLIIQAGAGTLTAAVTINGVNVTGLGAVAVTTGNTTANATAANTVAVGQTLRLVFSAVSGAANVTYALKTTRT